MPGSLVTVRFNLENARRDLGESVRLVDGGDPEEGYRVALRSRNGLFHARRAWCDLVGRNAPQMPVTGVAGGRREGHGPAGEALGLAIAATRVDGREAAAAVEPHLQAAERGFIEYLGYLKDEVGRRMRAASSPKSP